MSWDSVARAATSLPDEEGLMMDANRLRALPDRRDPVSRTQLIGRVRAEFAEMPCLRLTRLQAQRLFGLRPDVCQRVLEALVKDRTLCCDADDRYRFADDAARRPASSPSERVEHYRFQAS
jgi:hypothetical protein